MKDELNQTADMSVLQHATKQCDAEVAIMTVLRRFSVSSPASFLRKVADRLDESQLELKQKDSSEPISGYEMLKKLDEKASDIIKTGGKKIEKMIGKEPHSAALLRPHLPSPLPTVPEVPKKKAATKKEEKIEQAKEPVLPEEDAAGEKLLAQRIKSFLRRRTASLSMIFDEFGVKDSEQQQKIYKLLVVMHKEGIVRTSSFDSSRWELA